LARESWQAPSIKARATWTEKKSVFIADIAPISDASSAEQLITAAREEFPDARHHVYAWRIGGETFLQRFSDDGEPSGTAGLPVLDVMRKNDIEDAAIVVTRYFGGTLLGTGGLVRCYSRAAYLALCDSLPTRYIMGIEFNIYVAYTFVDKLHYAFRKVGFSEGTPQYADEAILTVFCPNAREEELRRMCLDLTGGKVSFERVGERPLAMECLKELGYEA